MSDVADPHLVATREALHAVAEHVLAAALHRWNGRIGLRATPGGFGTPEVEVGGIVRQARVEGVELVRMVEGAEDRVPLTTLASAAAFLDVPPGGPADVYDLVTPLDPVAPLAVDPTSTARIADWFALTDEALRAFAAEVAPDDPPVAQLWPEHFDLALSFEEVNYGGSPGDADHDHPYLYVGPWAVVPGPVWNEPWGASVPAAEVPTVDAALAVLRAGRAAAGR